MRLLLGHAPRSRFNLVTAIALPLLLLLATDQAPSYGGGLNDGFQVALSPPAARISIDIPGDGDVTAPFEIGGWAIDQGATTSAGIDAVHVYAYPDLFSGGQLTFLGAAQLGFARPDVAGAYGSQFGNAGWLMTVNTLLAGPYTLVAVAHSELTGSFDVLAARHVNVVALLSIDSPAPSAVVAAGTRVFVGGWAIDPGAPSGSGIDAVHVWIYPNGGAGAPFFAGAATYGVSRSDVGAVFGSRFTDSGYELDVNGLAPGTYLIAVSAHSPLKNRFVVLRTRAVTISP